SRSRRGSRRDERQGLAHSRDALASSQDLAGPMNPATRSTSVKFRPLLFLSYARSDAALADQLAAILEKQGCAVWMDRSELLTGDDFVLGLQRELAACDSLVLLLTTAAAESSWCQAE